MATWKGKKNGKRGGQGDKSIRAREKSKRARRGLAPLL